MIHIIGFVLWNLPCLCRKLLNLPKIIGVTNLGKTSSAPCVSSSRDEG